MANLVREDYFVCTEESRNSNKFWHIQEYDDANIVTRYGRVGQSEATVPKSFPSQSLATKFFNSKVKEKLRTKKHRDSYTRVEILSGTKSSRLAGTELTTIAAQEIDVDCDTTRELIKWLSQVNIHQILQSTTMTYDLAEGVFRTPLGVVGKSMVDRARILLNEIAPYVQIKTYDDIGFKKLANEYLRLIPQDLGGTKVKIKLSTIFTQEKMREQNDILDSLDASITSILTRPQPIGQQQTFNAKLHTILDQSIIDEIDKFFKETRQSQHVSYNYHIKTVYSVDIATMREAFEKDGANIKPHMRLWHGTKPSNVLSILKQGLVIPPSTAAFVCGRAYGDGVYFSDQSTKSLNYACGAWHGSGLENRVFMFLADVAMGKYYVPKSSFSGKLPQGYDSCWAQAGKSGVANNEMVIPRCSMANLVYLVEFLQ